MLSIIVPHVDEPFVEENIKEIKRLFPDSQIIKSDGSEGKGKALKNGSLVSNGELIVWIDVDLQVHPQEIKTFLKIMDLYDADVVVGNKQHSFSQSNYNLTRKIISETYNLIIRMLFGLNLRDTQCGLKIFKRDALLPLLKLSQMKGFGFDLEILVMLRDNKKRIVDAPVLVHSQVGKGSPNIKTIFVTFVETLKIWINKKKGLYKLNRG